MPQIRAQAAASELNVALRKYGTWGLVATAVVVHLSIAAQSVGPMYLFDEVGYLAGAKEIAGQSYAWSLCGSSYSMGYSAILAPLWWLPVTPVVLYQLAAFLSAAIGAAVIWPATALARRFGATPGIALAIGALVSLVPTRALLDNYVIAENPLTFLVVCAAVLAWRIADHNRMRDAVWFGVVIGLAAAVHARALPFVAIGVAWVVARWIVRAWSGRMALAAAVPAITLTAAGFLGQFTIGTTIFASGSRIDDLVGHVTLRGIGQVLLGQGFTQVVSWSLLTVLGLLACAARARRAVLSERVSGIASPWWWLGAMVTAQAAFFIVVVLPGFADFDTRLDAPIYGRYLDPFVVPLAVLGATMLWTGARRRLTTLALVAATVAVLAYGAVVLPRIPVDAKWIPFAIPGLEPFLSPSAGDDRSALAVAGGVALLGAVLLWFSRSLPRVGVAAALIVAAAVTLATDAARVDPFEGDVRARSVIAGFVYANPERPATLAADLLGCAERNKLQLELAKAATIVPSGGDYGDGYVVGPAVWPDATSDGRAVVPLTRWESSAVWFKP